METARALLVESLVPNKFWCEVTQTAVYLINSMPTPTLKDISPYEKLFGHPPSYSHLRVFGCLCFVHLPPHEHTKVSPQVAKCVFLGYNEDHKGFLCYDPNIRRLRISHNVVFIEHFPLFSLKPDFHVHDVSFLPYFLVQQLRPAIEKVYVRRQQWQQPIITLQTDPSPSQVSSSSSILSPPLPQLKRSTRITKPPDHFDFPACLLL